MKDQLQQIVHESRRRIIGLMSGTSADGVDAVLLEVQGFGARTEWELLAFTTTPFAPEIRAEILALQSEEPLPGGDSTGAPGAPGRRGGAAGVVERVARLGVRLAETYAEACAGVAEKAGFDLDEIHLAGMHGQTVFHGTAANDAPPATLQLGEAAVLAERTGLSVVSNFRARDVAAGGTGAPLVPYVDWLLFRSDEAARLCLNLGGIANITALSRGATLEQVVAFDTGPGNMVMDALVAHFTEGRETCDRNGARAAQAPPNETLLAGMLDHPWLARRPPKSAGREEFGQAFVRQVIERAKALGLSPAVTISTATTFTARSVAEAFRVHVLPSFNVDEVIASGGGVHNRTLMERLAAEMAPVPVRSSAYHGLDPDAKEAVAFALLANESIHGHAAALPSVTGARHAAILGAFVPGRRR